MKSLREVIKEADDKGIAIGHFNISNLEMLKGVFEAAKELNMPVIVGVSEGERDYIGVEQAVALVRSLREEYDFPIFLNADHSYSFERTKEAIDASFDAVIFDGAKLPLLENIEITKRCVDYARASGKDVLVEAEVGYIGTSSQVIDAIPEGIDLKNFTKKEEAENFINATGIDLFAPSVGNIHGFIKGIGNPALNIEAIRDLKNAIKTPLVLHGGSGISPEDFKEAIRAGIRIIHISTEMRVLYQKSTKEAIDESIEKNEVAPYKYDASVVEDLKNFVKNYITMFSSV
ncbi:MAG: Ketose-bisphosphate aldolase, class-II [Parcubacteria group bacterium LiPW_30]|nr:MAG: Ketose-bisphosphate aldolase, class-II [Parcubacteria group bacterium LiPW_30]